MNAVTIVDQPTEAGTVLQVIERASRDQSVDIDKLERLLAMHERIVARQAQAAYADALARMQPELPMIGERGGIKNNKGEIQSKYALWEDVVTAITPVLSRYGFSMSFRTGNEGDRVTVTGVLTHALGHSEQTSLTLPIDTSGSKNAVQSVGSSTSYGKRYTASALLNLRSGDIDDDGASGTTKEPWPEGYESRFADLRACADDGWATLQAAWKAQPMEFRTWIIKHRGTEWDGYKDVARKVPA